MAQKGQKKQVNTLDDCDSDAEVMFIGAISAENKAGLKLSVLETSKSCSN